MTDAREAEYRDLLRSVGFRVTDVRRVRGEGGRPEGLHVEARGPRGVVEIADVWDDGNETWCWYATATDEYGSRSEIGGDFDADRVTPGHVVGAVDARLP